jgi:hypothetical protein
MVAKPYRPRADDSQEADELRAMIKPGDTVYTVLRHVSKSGMMRAIDAYVYRDNEPRRITWSVCQVGNAEAYSRKHEAAKVSGCGFDAGFELVYRLSWALYPSYNCQGGRGMKGGRAKGTRNPCPSNEHVNPGPERDNYNRRRKHHDGYAISQRWQG